MNHQFGVVFLNKPGFASHRWGCCGLLMRALISCVGAEQRGAWSCSGKDTHSESEPINKLVLLRETQTLFYLLEKWNIHSDSHSTKHKLYPPCTSTPLIIDLELIEVVAAVIIFSVGTSTLLLPEPLYSSFGETLSALLKGSTLRQGRVLLHHLSSSVVNRLFVKARKRKLISICYFWTVINGRMPPL